MGDAICMRHLDLEGLACASCDVAALVGCASCRVAVDGLGEANDVMLCYVMLRYGAVDGLWEMLLSECNPP